jgi:hypothetical protein
MEGEAHLAEQTAVGALHLHSLLVPRIGLPATTALGFFSAQNEGASWAPPGQSHFPYLIRPLGLGGSLHF